MQAEKKRKLLVKTLDRFKNKVNPEELSKGIKEEASEHDDPKDKATNVFKGNKMSAAKTAIAHLKKDPKYYQHLETMENKYKK